MARHNFSAAVKRQARNRAEGRCEAVGSVYGLAPGQRCNASLDGKRVEIDHYPIPATDEGSDRRRQRHTGKRRGLLRQMSRSQDSDLRHSDAGQG